MALRSKRPVTWAQNASLSSFFEFGGDAPNGIILPNGLQGARLVFVGAESNTAGDAADPATAQVIYDMNGSQVAMVIPASIPAEGVRIAFWSGAMRAQGWLALRTVDAAGVAQVQSAARTASWLFPFPSA